MTQVVLRAGTRDRLLLRALQAAVVLLVLIGVAAAALRAVHLEDLATRMEPTRRQALLRLDVHDPFADGRLAEAARFDRGYAERPLVTLLHVVPGALFLLLGTLQLSAAIRSRHPRLHRWTGRLLVLAGAAAGLTGLYFGLFQPYAGAGEATVIALVGGLLLVSLLRGWRAIRRRRVDLHREWMIRAFALLAAVSTVRVVALGLELVATPLGLPPRGLFVVSLWLGWALTLGAAELWIRRTRRAPAHATATVPAPPVAAGGR